MRKNYCYAVLFAFIAVACVQWRVWCSPYGFLIKPYLQLGPGSTPASLQLLWQTADSDAQWAVEVKRGAAWRAVPPPAVSHRSLENLGKFRAYYATLPDLPDRFDYRVLRNGQQVFAATGHARKSASQPYRFVLFGDAADGSPEERRVAYQTMRARPDLVLIAGDIVYPRGLDGEYRKNFFPVYNADNAAPVLGAPLLRSIPFVACPGNHDIGISRYSFGNLDAYPDAMAFFTFFSEPLNGPRLSHDPLSTQVLAGPPARVANFRAAAGARFPRMADFSFDYGNTHWTMLDSNHYRDWSDAELRAWLRQDLAAARAAVWKFVVFHHPPFHSSHEHARDQWMRVLVDIFQEQKVDVVFCGHVHNYERSRPLLFHIQPAAPRVPPKDDAALRHPPKDTREVPGTFDMDRVFDGHRHTHPRGILYLVSGGGGAELYDAEQESRPSTWLPFTERFVAHIHSMTQADVSGRVLKVRQIGEDGRPVDEFTVTK